MTTATKSKRKAHVHKKPTSKPNWGAGSKFRPDVLKERPAKKRKRLKPITPSMYMVMELVHDGKNLFTGCTHERTYGARSISIDATRARGLINESGHSDCGYVLTSKGNASRNRKVGLKMLASLKGRKVKTAK